MRASLPGLLALAATLLGPFSAAAAAIPAPAPPTFEVRTGDAITTRIPVLPAGAREFELVLVPEGGADIQVVTELPAGVSEVTWRMPRTYASRARLVLRSGDARSECRSEPSAEFVLAPLRPEDIARLVSGNAEGRQRIETFSAARASVSGSAGSTGIEPGAIFPCAVQAPSPPAVMLVANRPLRLDPGRVVRAPSPCTRTESAGPAHVPLRN